MEYASMKMPDLVRPGNEQKKLREVYRDYALMVFHLQKPMTIAKLCDMADELYGLTMMYHHIRSRHTDYGQSLCFFQEPGTGEMFQMDCSTDGHGRIVKVDVKLYISMERMVTELRQQLRRVQDSPGEFAYKLEEAEVITAFL